MIDKPSEGHMPPFGTFDSPDTEASTPPPAPEAPEAMKYKDTFHDYSEEQLKVEANAEKATGRKAWSELSRTEATKTRVGSAWEASGTKMKIARGAGVAVGAIAVGSGVKDLFTSETPDKPAPSKLMALGKIVVGVGAAALSLMLGGKAHAVGAAR